MNTLGKNVTMNVFGESHGSLMGVTINGLVSGLEIDFDYIKTELKKRSSKLNISTPRKEPDEFEVVSGYFNGYTTGAPLTFIVKNIDVRSRDYDELMLRPSHADLVAKEKYNSFNDYRGGGVFSGRLTVLYVIAGALAKSLLMKKGIEVFSHIYEVGEFKEKSYLNVPVEQWSNEHYGEIIEYITYASSLGDSVGGTIETAVIGLPIGIGEPLFGSLESRLSNTIFAIPGIKGIEFGAGFEFSRMLGSEANDLINKDFTTSTNNSGGINGGISNGMPIVFKSVFRPTPSIRKEQETVNYNKEPKTIKIKGRHDACIFVRGMHVINNLTAFALLDAIVESEGRSWMS